MIGSSRLRLGKRPAILDRRTPRLDGMLLAHLPEPPARCDHGIALGAWKLWRNGDQLAGHEQTLPGLGDCTAVAVASAIRVMTAGRGGEIELTDDQVVRIYEDNGYDPQRPATDQGAAERDVLNRWCETGYGVGRQAPDVLTAYGAVNPKSSESVRRAIAMLGGLYIGLDLPEYALVQGCDWVAPTAPAPAAGGHAVFLHGYDGDWLYLNSWGERKRMDWGFFRSYCDEAYGLLSRDWLDTGGHTPMQESFETLAVELKAALAA